MWCWSPWESCPHDCSPLAAQELSWKDSTRRSVFISGGHGDKKGSAPLCQLPTAPFAEMIHGIFQVFNMFPETRSARQKGVFVNCRWIQGEISVPHTAITQVGNNSEKLNLTGLSLYIILWLSEIKCNFDCLINVTHYFFLTWIKIPAQGFRNVSLWVDWNYLDLKDIFLFEEQNFIKLIKKEKK